MFLESDIRDEIEDSRDFWGSKPISKSEARFNVVEEKLEDYPLNLMDNIVLRNSPFRLDDVYPFWANPYFTRKVSEGFPIPVKVERKSHRALIHIGFPAYASLSEMIDLLKQNFSEIQKERAKSLPVPPKKDYRKVGLEKSIDAYTMFVNGQRPERIAIELDKKYGGEHTFESIQILINRMKEEAKRFDKSLEIEKKQETLPFL